VRNACRWFVCFTVLLATEGCGDGGGRSKPTPAPTASAPPAHAGDLDPSFGEKGLVTSNFGQFDTAFGVAVQVDGKIVATGNTISSVAGSPGSQQLVALARYNVDGTPDATFGPNGQITTTIRGNEAARAIALASDGKIVVGGGTTRLVGSGSDFFLARYNPDGSLDAGFGTDGLVVTSVGTSGSQIGAAAVAIQPDGKILAAGTAADVMTGDEFALVRYDTDGSLDASFGIGGIALTSASVDSGASAIALQSDGNILLGGVALVQRLDQPVPDFAFALVRYLPSGVTDATFGSGGVVVTDVTPGSNSSVQSLVVEADGGIVVAGTIGGHFPRGSNESALARYRPDGTLDQRFGMDGFATLTSGVSALTLQSDGKIIAAGAASVDSGPSSSFALARYTSDGALDTSFGDAGIRTTMIGLSSGIAGSSLYPDEKLIVAGSTNTADGSDFALARYLLGGN